MVEQVQRDVTDDLILGWSYKSGLPSHFVLLSSCESTPEPKLLSCKMSLSCVNGDA